MSLSLGSFTPTVTCLTNSRHDGREFYTDGKILLWRKRLVRWEGKLDQWRRRRFQEPFAPRASCRQVIADAEKDAVHVGQVEEIVEKKGDYERDRIYYRGKDENKVPPRPFNVHLMRLIYHVTRFDEIRLPQLKTHPAICYRDGKKVALIMPIYEPKQ